eukprot:1792530-Rhodomonas_salina.6
MQVCSVLLCFAAIASGTAGPTRTTGDASTVLRKLGYPFANNLTHGEPIRIAVTLPITTRGEEDVPTRELRFFKSFLPSFVETVQPLSWPCSFEFYIGMDVGDPLLESKESLAEFIGMFYEVVSSVPIECGEMPQCFTMTIKRFESSNALTVLWNGLNEAAFLVLPSPATAVPLPCCWCPFGAVCRQQCAPACRRCHCESLNVFSFVV